MRFFNSKPKRKQVIEILQTPFEWRGPKNRKIVRKYFQNPLDVVDEETARLIVSYKPQEFQDEWKQFLQELKQKLGRRAFLGKTGKVVVGTILSLAGIEMLMRFLGLSNAQAALKTESLDKKSMLKRLNLHYGYRYSESFIKAVYSTTFDKDYMKDAPLALFLVNSNDPNIAFLDNRAYDKFIQGYRIILCITISDKQVVEQIQQTYHKFGKISFLLIGGHGNQFSLNLWLGSYERSHVDIFDVKRLKSVSRFLTKDCPLVLDSCLTGKGNLNLAKMLSELLNRDVYAAKEITHSVDFSFDKNNRFVSATLFNKLRPVTVRYSPSKNAPKLIDFLNFFTRAMNNRIKTGEDLYRSASHSEKVALKYFGENYTPQELYQLVSVFNKLYVRI